MGKIWENITRVVNNIHCHQITTDIERKCHNGGFFFLSGAPYVISLPHFFEGEPELQRDVIGINPSLEKHKSYFDIEPNTGFVLNAAVRVELNGVTRHLPEYK